ncbi:hypothetical protein PRZ48_010403 [Zasmidium cellare]|uniref:Neutral protease 2 n=1 Tax=Zasmidium cellare TaxID=395010 RepID=A0ABR0E8J2_ZASCE|nr:hypothetical protein PRZ48_010403 [Zasmidium cellare]
MKFTAISLAAWAALASSTAIDINKRASALEVTLEAVGNSKVKASVTNTASEGYNLLYKGSFLDSSAPVDKFVVSSSSARAAFNGVQLRVATVNEVLTAENFITLEAGQTLSTEVDLAELYDVETSDSYTIQAQGALPYAALNTTTLTGSALPFTSNQLAMTIDGAQAKTVAYALKTLDKRTRLQTCSSSSRASTLRTALSNCASLASTAATAATSGSSSKFQEYFKTTSSSVRSTVAARLRAVASDCSSSSSGSTTTYCNDPYGYCTSGVLAYTIPSQNVIAYCDLFYTGLSGLSRTCHGQDQATTVLHESTHAPAVYSPGTDDLGYGYSAAQQLSSTQAVLNADTYALYANALYVGC